MQVNEKLRVPITKYMTISSSNGPVALRFALLLMLLYSYLSFARSWGLWRCFPFTQARRICCNQRVLIYNETINNTTWPRCLIGLLGQAANEVIHKTKYIHM